MRVASCNLTTLRRPLHMEPPPRVWRCETIQITALEGLHALQLEASALSICFLHENTHTGVAHDPLMFMFPEPVPNKKHKHQFIPEPGTYVASVQSRVLHLNQSALRLQRASARRRHDRLRVQSRNGWEGRI